MAKTKAIILGSDVTILKQKGDSVMKTKAVVLTFLALSLSFTLLLHPASAYDATGTWDWETSNGRSECSMTPPLDNSGEFKITQYGNLINIKLPYQLGECSFSGSAAGSRYQAFGPCELSHYKLVFDLVSAYVGKGYMLVNSNSSDSCYKSWDLLLKKRGTCTPSDTVMCLQDGRFRVSVKWWDEHGNTGVGTAIPSTDDSGIFWFFNSSNMELLIKVLDGCGINNKYWVFFAATTDQKFTVKVDDLQKGQQVEYTNPLKNPADAVTDTSAFDTCP